MIRLRLRRYAASAERVRRYAASAERVRLRLRRFHLRASRYGGQVAASAERVRLCLATAVFVTVMGGSSVLACPVCFGAEETTMIDGTRIGIFVLLGITLAMQGAFAGFFFYLRMRAKRIADADLDTEWANLQNPSRTS